VDNEKIWSRRSSEIATPSAVNGNKSKRANLVIYTRVLGVHLCYTHITTTAAVLGASVVSHQQVCVVWESLEFFLHFEQVLLRQKETRLLLYLHSSGKDDQQPESSTSLAGAGSGRRPTTGVLYITSRSGVGKPRVQTLPRAITLLRQELELHSKTGNEDHKAFTGSEQ